MSAAVSMPSSSIEAAASALRAAEEAHAAAVADVERASRDEDAATRRYDDAGTDAALEKVNRARLKRERAERIAAAKASELATARDALHAAETAQKRADFDAKVARLRALRDVVRPHLSALVEIERAAAKEVDRIADVLVDLDDAWVEAQRLAKDLGVQDAAAIERPSMHAVAYLARVAIAMAHKAEDRAPIGAQWLSPESEPTFSEDPQPWAAATAWLATAAQKGRS